MYILPFPVDRPQTHLWHFLISNYNSNFLLYVVPDSPDDLTTAKLRRVRLKKVYIGNKTIKLPDGAGQRICCCDQTTISQCEFHGCN